MESKAIEMQMSFRNCCCCDVGGGGGGWIQRRGLIPIVGCSLPYVFYLLRYIDQPIQTTHTLTHTLSPLACHRVDRRTPGTCHPYGTSIALTLKG